LSWTGLSFLSVIDLLEDGAFRRAGNALCAVLFMKKKSNTLIPNESGTKLKQIAVNERFETFFPVHPRLATK
jgi:hypothetical protein